MFFVFRDRSDDAFGTISDGSVQLFIIIARRRETDQRSRGVTRRENANAHKKKTVVSIDTKQALSFFLAYFFSSSFVVFFLLLLLSRKNFFTLSFLSLFFCCRLMEEEEKKRQKKDEKKIGRKKSALFLWETKESSRHFLVLSPLSLSHDFKAHHHLWDIAKEESDDDDDERQRREEGRCINTFSKEREKKKRDRTP